MSKRDFLALEDWSAADIERLLNLAARVKRGEVAGGLEKRVLGLMLEPGQESRASFEIAMYLHGGAAVDVEPGEPGLPEDPESIGDGAVEAQALDAVRVHARYCDALVVRALPRTRDWVVARRDLLIRTVAQHCEKPVINAGSARRHPCQALADAMTLRERLGHVEGKRFVLTWAWTPDAFPTAVPASAALAAAQQGMEIVIARPEGYELDPEDTALIRKTAQQSGGEFVHIMDDPDDALVGADAVYVASWGSLKLYGKPEQESETRSALRDWRLSQSRLRSSRGGRGVVLHSLPVRRNAEIDDAVLDGPNSAVVDQAENRLHVQRALLLDLLSRQ
ncbi:MAG TPA: N-acetylornithine carbamoyltransferase [Gemmatimonadales bacterium]